MISFPIFNDTLFKVMNPCNSNPCQNQGTCSVNGVSSTYTYFCTCPSGYTGVNCQTCKQFFIVHIKIFKLSRIIFLSSQQSLQFESMSKSRFIEFLFNLKQIKVFISLNSGTCYLSSTSYSCACPIGFTGSNCQTGFFSFM